MSIISKIKTAISGYQSNPQLNIEPTPPRVLVSNDIGGFPDEMDTLQATDDVYGVPSSPFTLQDIADADPQFAASMPKYWLATNPSEAFADFLDCGIPDAVIRLMSQFGVEKRHHICDLGCGAGHLVYSLARRGFEHLAAMDPSADGTGYLKSAVSQVDVIKSIETWRTIASRFDAIVSNGTIHHWHHIPLIARDARRTMKPGGYWFAIQEAYANTPRDLAMQMRNHPTASRFGHYEWFYPASAYVDLVQSVGFALVGVIPFGYRGNELLMSTSGVVGDSFSNEVDGDIGATVETFWQEVDSLRRNKETAQRFTIPQALVFRRIAI